MSKHLLILEIRTQASSPPQELDLLPIMTIMQDAHHNYFFATGIDRIKSAIIDSLPHLGTNYRYPLSFQLQIITGDRIDALIASSTENLPPGRRQRFTKKN